MLLRDETTFDDAFRASAGPGWNTQHVGQPRGEHWLNTWFTGHYFQKTRLYEVPPWDLLVWHAPQPGCKLSVAETPEKTPFNVDLFATRYAWEGDVRPGQRRQFVQVLLPHAPMRDASPLAAGIEALANRPGLTALEVAQGRRCELCVLNPQGHQFETETKSAGQLRTDARAVYLDLDNGQVRRALAIGGTHLGLGSSELFRSAERRDFEKPGAAEPE